VQGRRGTSGLANGAGIEAGRGARDFVRQGGRNLVWQRARKLVRHGRWDLATEGAGGSIGESGRFLVGKSGRDLVEQRARHLKFVSWPGLARPPTTSHQANRQIVPFRVPGDDQPNLPGSGPAFKARFALNGREHVPMWSRINQTEKFVSAGECRSDPGLMFAHAAAKVVRHTEVQCSVRTIRHDVDPASRHGQHHARGRLRMCLRPAKSWVAGPSPAMTKKRMTRPLRPNTTGHGAGQHAQRDQP
jgi:hypothetical protein